MKLEAISIAGVSIFSRLSRFLILPLLALSMSPQELGKYELLMASLLVFEMVVILKMPEAMFRVYFDYENTEKVFFAALQIGFFSCLFCAILLAFLSQVFECVFTTWFVISCIVLPKIIGLVCAEYLRARKEFFSYFLINSIPSMAFLCWVMGVYFSREKIFYSDILVGLFGVNILMLAFAVALCPGEKKSAALFRAPYTRDIYKILLTFGVGLIPSAVAWWAMRLSNRWIASDLYGLKEVAWLGVANYLPMILTAIGVVFYTSSQRYIYNADALASSKSDGVKKAFRLYAFSQVLCVVLLMCLESLLEYLEIFSSYGEMSVYVLIGLMGITMLNLGSFLGALLSSQYRMIHLSLTAMGASGICVVVTYIVMSRHGVEYFGVPIIVAGVFLVVSRIWLLTHLGIRCVGYKLWVDLIVYALVITGLALDRFLFDMLACVVLVSYAAGCNMHKFLIFSTGKNA